MDRERPAPPGAHWHRYRAGAAGPTGLASQAHVWRVALDGVSARLATALSCDERARADRFAGPEHRRRFIAARVTLRAILADCLPARADPQGRGLRLGYGPAGKPFLLDDPGLRFNVSHSENLALIAVTRAGEVGVDVERQRRLDDMAGIAGLVFDEAEQAAVRHAPPATRDAIFYQTWTRKEALLKATGVGIAGLDRPGPDRTGMGASGWLVTTLADLDGFAAALVRPEAARDVRLWTWPGWAGLAGRGDPTSGAVP